MFISLTTEQEEKIMINPSAITDITKYAVKIANALPAVVKPKALTYEEKLNTPCSCSHCEEIRLVKLAEYNKSKGK
jgi:hypothetical protein